MKHTATVTSKGQVTIPQAVRNRLGLREGDRLEFVNEGGNVIVRPVRGEDNPFAAYVGALGTFPEGLDAIKAWVRELRDEEPSSAAEPPAERPK